ncbi:MAG: hypothetical protein U0Q16_12525 [Bryobacteraceae bacterium]
MVFDGDLSANAHLALVHHDEFAAHADPGQAQDCAPEQLINCLLGRGMKPQSHDTWSFCRWKHEHVGEISVKREKDPLLFNGNSPDFFVIRSREADFRDRNGIVAEAADRPRMER